MILRVSGIGNTYSSSYRTSGLLHSVLNCNPAFWDILCVPSSGFGNQKMASVGEDPDYILDKP